MNRYLFINKEGEIILEVDAYTRDTAIHLADTRYNIKGDKYIEIKRRKK